MIIFFLQIRSNLYLFACFKHKFDSLNTYWIFDGPIKHVWHVHTVTRSHVHTVTCSHSHMFTWSHVHTVTWSHGHMFTCSHGHMFTRSHVHPVTCSHGHMFTWSHVHTVTCWHVHTVTCSHGHMFTRSHGHTVTCSHGQIRVWNRCTGKIWNKFEGKIKNFKIFIYIYYFHQYLAENEGSCECDLQWIDYHLLFLIQNISLHWDFIFILHALKIRRIVRTTIFFLIFKCWNITLYIIY